MISAKVVRSFATALLATSTLAQNELRAVWAQFNFADVDSVKVALQEVMPALVTKYGDVAASAAAEFYDDMRAASSAPGIYAATLAPNISAEATQVSTRAVIGGLYGRGAADKVLPQLLGVLDRNVKKSARDTITHNAHNDHHRPMFARVPSGATTCNFCLMLASRGFVYSSANSAGEMGQFHSNCDCQIVPSWDANPHVEGYSPQALYDQWQAQGAQHNASDNQAAI